MAISMHMTKVDIKLPVDSRSKLRIFFCPDGNRMKYEPLLLLSFKKLE